MITKEWQNAGEQQQRLSGAGGCEDNLVNSETAEEMIS